VAAADAKVMACTSKTAAATAVGHGQARGRHLLTGRGGRAARRRTQGSTLLGARLRTAVEYDETSSQTYDRGRVSHQVATRQHPARGDTAACIRLLDCLAHLANSGAAEDPAAEEAAHPI
jgi:hypothetical protein